MAFIQQTAPDGLRNSELLSADNAIPERHIVIATLRTAAPRLGISASVLSTLDAMLSCLAPKRTHHTVFASNATLTFRCNGISERTIRRHAAVLQEAGLLIRRDSPNGKRFTKHNKHAGKALRFGFDLTPLFQKLHEICGMAADVTREQEQISYLRSKIRAAASETLKDDPHNEWALSTLRVLRRKLALIDCEHLLSQCSDAMLPSETDADNSSGDTTELTASDGKFVRHHHKSNKEYTDKNSNRSSEMKSPMTSETENSVLEIVNACPEAAQFSLKPVVTADDVVVHARTLRPMLGITPKSYEEAETRLGKFRAATTIWAIMQFHEKIGSIGAYFKSITVGTKSGDFSPERLIRRLAKAQSYVA